MNAQYLLDVVPAIAIFYFIFFWGLPMLGMSTNRWVNEVERGTSERKKRYWYGVRYMSGLFHLSAFLAAALFKFVLYPNLFPGA